MNTIIDYCQSNFEQLEKHEQKKFTWKKYKSPPFTEIAEFKACLGEIPEAIGREDIIQAFKSKKYYKGFVMAMLWGGISIMPKRDSDGDKRTSHAFQAFSTPINNINDTMDKLTSLIFDNKVEHAYQLIANEHKITGVDVSFFTKILSFLSETIEPTKNLLIYDKWTKLTHVHLLLDFGKDPTDYYTPNKISNLYKLNANGIFKTELISPKKGREIDAYMNYNALTKIVSDQLSNSRNIDITPFQLESFLFGSPISKKNKSNPRYWIQQNFAQHYLPNLGVV